MTKNYSLIAACLLIATCFSFRTVAQTDALPAHFNGITLDAAQDLLSTVGEQGESFHDYKTRINGYLTVLDEPVDIWEVGNEVNGEWQS